MTRALAAGAAVAWLGPGLAPHAPPLARALRVARRIPGAGVALTFDDGPHPEGTPAVLAELARRGARATFFLVAEQVERRPALAAEVAAAGHEIALHGFRHHNQMLLPPPALASDLSRAVAVIGEATGSDPRAYRPPYGIFTPAGLALAHHAGWRPLLWSRWGRDWTLRSTPAQIAARATRDISAGDVVLLHDADYYSEPGSWRNTVRALPRIIDALGERGLAAVRCSA